MVQFSIDYRVTGTGAIATGGQAIDQVDGTTLQTQISQTQVFYFRLVGYSFVQMGYKSVYCGYFLLFLILI